MALSLGSMDAAVVLKHLETTHDFMYMVRRSSYEFVFAVPKTPHDFLTDERPVFLVHFKNEQRMQGFVLNPEELEDFHAGLDQLMEYIARSSGRGEGSPR